MVLQKPEDKPQDEPAAPASGLAAPPPENDDLIDEAEVPTAEADKPLLTVPPYEPPKPPRELSENLRNILLAISGVFLIMAMCSAWLLAQGLQDKDSDDKKTPTSQVQPGGTVADTPTITCADDLTIYKNQDLGFGFCYPAVWGAVTVADGKLSAADSGKRWKVTFADKDAVQVDLLTKDWSTKKTSEYACVPTTTAMPAYAPLVTTWSSQKDGAVVASASRGIAAQDGKYIIREFTEAKTLKGACLQGFTPLAGSDYGYTATTYQAAFNTTITAPDQHQAAPETLIPAADRGYVAAITQSMQAL